MYADGIKMFDCENNDKYNVIPKAARVVSIRGYNRRGKAYFVATFSNGFKTISGSDKWTCTDEEHPGWMAVDFNDSGVKHGTMGHTIMLTRYGPRKSTKTAMCTAADISVRMSPFLFVLWA